MRNFIGYYKWHLIFLALILICVGFIAFSFLSNSESDIVIGYFGTEYVNEQTFSDNKAYSIETLLHDANGDDKKLADLVTYTVDEGDVARLLNDAIETKSYHIYIAPKSAFEEVDDLSVFATLDPDTVADALSTSEGRVYAVSVEGNSLLNKLGFINNDNLYIAAANFGGEELSTKEKNGANIAKHIIENRTK